MDPTPFWRSFDRILTEGSVRERLRRQEGLRWSGVLGYAELLFSEQGRLALESIHREYLRIGDLHDLPMVLETPTWRVDRDHLQRADSPAGRTANTEAVRLPMGAISTRLPETGGNGKPVNEWIPGAGCAPGQPEKRHEMCDTNGKGKSIIEPGQGRSLSRRSFLGSVGGAGLTAAMGSRTAFCTSQETRIPVCIFSKHLQWLGFDEMAEAAARLGFDGVDLTVRPGGHVEPENVKRDLPLAVQAVRQAGLKTLIMTTAVVDAEDDIGRSVVSTASGLGITHYRLGYHYYSETESIDDTLERVRRQLAGLAELNERLQIRGGIQNHAGLHYFGASIWDMREALRGLDPRWIGCQFDLRHAVVEGTMNWAVDFRAVEKFVHTIVFKDFRWEPGAERMELINCPLGEGVTDFKTFIPMLHERRFLGPATLHCEFPLGGADHGSKELTIPAEAVLSAIKKDLEVARRWIAAD